MQQTYSDFPMRQAHDRPLQVRVAALAVFLVALVAALTVRHGPGVADTAWPATHLVMLEEAGCTYCLEWETVIGPVYPKTPEGGTAPLRKVDIHGIWPDDLAAIRKDVFTPTFILVHDGQEIGRIRGYPGEDFFWGLLGQMLRKLPDKPRTADSVSLEETSG